MLGLGVVASMRSGVVEPPKVGERAPAIELKTPGGTSVMLSGLVKDGPAVVLASRGWPGYQCLLCTRQVREYLEAARISPGRGQRRSYDYLVGGGAGEHAAQLRGRPGMAGALPVRRRSRASDGGSVRAPVGCPGRDHSDPTTLVVDREGLVRFVR